MRFVAAALFVLSFVLALPLQGQIVTDRPSFVESSLTVPERSVQGEVGFAYSDLGSDASTWSTPALLRLWLASGAELRIATGGLSSFSGGDETETDLGNVLLGTKIHLADGVGGGPSTALLIHIPITRTTDVPKLMGPPSSSRTTRRSNIFMPGVAPSRVQNHGK